MFIATAVMRDPVSPGQWLIYEVSDNPDRDGAVWGRTWNDPDGTKAVDASLFIMWTGAQPTMEGYATSADNRWRTF